MSSITALILSIAAVIGIIVMFILDKFTGTLNIKSRPVGDGQFGMARWATKKEIDEAFQTIPFEPRKWRKGINRPTQMNGTTVLGYLGSKDHVRALVDQSDSNTILTSPPGGR